MNSAERILPCGFLVLIFVLGAATIGWSIPQGVIPATPKASTPTAVDPAVAMWNKGDYSAAIAEFQKILQQEPDQFAWHTTFIRNAANAASKESRLKYERDRSLAVQKAPKQDAGQEKKAEGAAPAYVPPPVLTAAELAKMEADVNAANAALAQLMRLYEEWAKANPKKAVYAYELALLTNRQEFEKREQYLVKAVSLDPNLTEGFQQLFSLNAGIDDAAAAKYAKKAADSKPGDFQLQLTYASALWTADQAGGRKFYRDLVARNAGTKNGATALQQFVATTEDPKEKAELIGQFRREYPNEWSPGHAFNSTLYAQYMAADPAKGLAFAREILKGLEDAAPAPNAKAAQATAERNKTTWKSNVDYADALVQARTLIAGKKGTDALALLEKTKVPRALEESSQLTVCKAEAAAASGDNARAYEMLAAELVKDINEDYQTATIKYGAKLGKSPKQVDEELWSRRMQKAEAFKEFDLPKLGGPERVKLSDLRGKVVLADFWFPG